MTDTILMVSTSSNNMQSLGKIVLHMPAVRVKIWRLSCHALVCWHTVRSRGHSLNKYCVVVYRQIQTMFSPFFRSDCPFRHTSEFPFLSQSGATIFAKLQSQTVKSPEISGKFLCTPLSIQLSNLKKIPLQQFRAENVDVHLYKFFLHKSLQC